MLDRKFEGIETDSNGKFVGVRADGQVVKARFVVGDPTYFPDKVHKVGQVVRSINIIKGVLANTKDADSLQVILPQKPTGRHHDTYMSIVTHQHMIAPAGFKVATLSTTVETENPAEELAFASSLLPDKRATFVIVKDIFEPNTDGVDDQIFISKSYDATSHFETASLDILDIWRRITGSALDLSKTIVQEGEAASSE